MVVDSGTAVQCIVSDSFHTFDPFTRCGYNTLPFSPKTVSACFSLGGRTPPAVIFTCCCYSEFYCCQSLDAGPRQLHGYLGYVRCSSAFSSRRNEPFGISLV